jgi:hypothetical protein
MARVLIDASGRFVLAGARGFVDAPLGADTGIPVASDPPIPGTSTTTALTLTDFKTAHALAFPVVQRRAGTYDDTNAGSADMPVLFTFAGGAPSYPQARVIKAVGGAVVKDWTTLANVSVVGSTGLGTLAAVPAGAGYLLQIRDGQQPSNGATNSSGAQRWGVGVCVLAMGQSNMVGTLSADGPFDIVPGTSLKEVEYYEQNGNGVFFGTAAGFVSTGATSVSTGSTSSGSDAGPSYGGTLSFVRIVAAGLKAKYGKDVPVCLIPWAFGATSIDYYLPGGAAYDGLFLGTGARAGTVNFKSTRDYWAGDFEGCVWHQNEADDAMDGPTYLGRLKTLYGKLLEYVVPFGRDASTLFFLPAVPGVYASITNVEGKRKAVLDLDAYARANNWPLVRAGWNCLDLDPRDGGDGLHFQDVAGGMQYRRMSVKRLTQAVKYMVKCASFTGLGPKITSATRAGNVITVNVAHDGGSALVLRKAGQPITGWSVKDNTGATITAAVAIASANTVTLTLSGSPVYPVTIQHGGGMGPDVSNVIVDNVSYPEGCSGLDLMTNGRPVLPTPDAIPVT